MGSTGPQGPPGPQGKKGQEGYGLSGVSYNRWGRKNCSGDATLVYTGREERKVGEPRNSSCSRMLSGCCP